MKEWRQAPALLRGTVIALVLYVLMVTGILMYLPSVGSFP